MHIGYFKPNFTPKCRSTRRNTTLFNRNQEPWRSIFHTSVFPQKRTGAVKSKPQIIVWNVKLNVNYIIIRAASSKWPTPLRFIACALHSRKYTPATLSACILYKIYKFCCSFSQCTLRVCVCVVNIILANLHLMIFLFMMCYSTYIILYEFKTPPSAYSVITKR